MHGLPTLRVKMLVRPSVHGPMLGNLHTVQLAYNGPQGRAAMNAGRFHVYHNPAVYDHAVQYWVWYRVSGPCMTLSEAVLGSVCL